jgi:CheY-like chemotaxis protein
MPKEEILIVEDDKNISKLIKYNLEREGYDAFAVPNGEEALEHLLKSGAGTAFYETVSHEYREALEKEFIARLKKRNGNRASFEVVHDYLACTAVKAG